MNFNLNMREIIKSKDERPKKGLWAPGNYWSSCCDCEKTFIGDKRALMCAPCAYDGELKIIPHNGDGVNNETKFTPGPWVHRYWHGDGWPDTRISISDDEGKALFINARYAENSAPNAYLIAAAPDIYESNIQLLDSIKNLLANKPIKNLDEIISFAEKSIAKARGE